MAARTGAPTPIRTIRVPDEVWERAQRKAAEEDTTVSALINEWLRDYTS